MTLTDTQRAQVEALLDDGCSLREIARTIHVNRNLIAREYRGRGWTYVQAGQFAAAMRRHHTGCSVHGCHGDHLAKGLCSKHYNQARKAQKARTA